MDASTTELISTRSTLRPKFFYVCSYYTNQLHRVNLLTGEWSCHRVHDYQFKNYCQWSELPGGSLLITGGYPAGREVVKLDTLREFAISAQPPMHTARGSHAVVYHSQYLYSLGGHSDNSYLRECERYVWPESRWEVLPALPVACCAMSAVVMDNSLYALGGHVRPSNQKTVQKLNLRSLTWELMKLKLPQAARFVPCFKTDTQVYLVLERTLYSLTPLKFKPIQTLDEGVSISVSSYYSRGTLYYSYYSANGVHLAVGELAVGELA
jgi:hypothetical protein